MGTRRRSDALEDLFELATRLPWWISAGIAVVSFLALSTVWQSASGLAAGGSGSDLASPIVHSAFATAAGLARWIIPPIFFIVAAASWWKARRRAGLLGKTAVNPAELNRLSWRDFERLIGEAYRQQGYEVTELGGDGPDGGIDLVLRRDHHETLVQCKQWRRQRVGVTTVRELRGVMAQRCATAGAVVGLGGFTREAEEFARSSGIQLLERQAVEALVRGLPMPVASEVPAAHTGAQECPQCGSMMVRRTARRGRHAGREFFGCSQYPKCRAIVEAGEMDG